MPPSWLHTFWQPGQMWTIMVRQVEEMPNIEIWNYWAEGEWWAQLSGWLFNSRLNYGILGAPCPKPIDIDAIPKLFAYFSRWNSYFALYSIQRAQYSFWIEFNRQVPILVMEVKKTQYFFLFFLRLTPPPPYGQCFLIFLCAKKQVFLVQKHCFMPFFNGSKFHICCHGQGHKKSFLCIPLWVPDFHHRNMTN